MPPKRVRRSRSRQTTPQSPPKSNLTRASPRSTRQAASSKSAAHEQPSKSLLPALEEEVDAGSVSEIEVNLSNRPSSTPQTREGSNENQDGLDDGRSDTDSNGTTQLEVLDLNDICEDLPQLYREATRILSFLDVGEIPDAIHGLQDRASQSVKRFRKVASHLNQFRGSYGENTYINTQLILRKATDDLHITEGPWRPDAVLQLANLARLVQDILLGDNNTIYDTLQRMYHTFPEPFVNSSADAQDTHLGTERLKEIISLGLTFRTQFFIKHVERFGHEQNFDPETILGQAFSDRDGWLGTLQPEDGEAPIDGLDEIDSHVTSIRSTFGKKAKNPIDLSRLQREHPWQNFLVQASTWALRRRTELDSQIRAQGGVDAIKTMIKQKDFTPFPPISTRTLDRQESKDRVLHQMTEQQARSSLVDHSAMTKRATRLREIQAQESQEDSDESDESNDQPQTTQLSKTSLRSPVAGRKTAMTEIPQTPEAAIADLANNDFIGIGDDDNGTEDPEPESRPSRTEHFPAPTQSSIVPTQQTRAILEIERQNNLIGNKENIDSTRRGFSDRQPNARKIQWDESQTRRKRPRAESGEDGTDENDDFDTDTRPRKRTRQRRPQPPHAVDDWLGANAGDDVIGNEADEDVGIFTQNNKDHPATRPPPSAQPPRRPSPPRPSQSTQSSQHRSKPASRHDQRPTASGTTRDSGSQREELPPATQHQQVNHDAKAIMLKVSSFGRSQVRPPQSRRAWTPDEINRLFDLMAEYGCGWSRILQEDKDHEDGPCLQQRSQVQLKDKARNIKMDYLKSGTQVPAGFLDVTIKTADKTLLASMGLPWE